ncbi:hypothetical protein NDU88_008814 [Pleurodeles waltl]|uniref:Uncharacterized protein n=1 Tax=Pleurodeles waltl TaxID=8319 RepID=A0AAV7PT49_PLEWA|nr:hypothetical protein NDU88_008814 [Pleurodeles waltl]
MDAKISDLTVASTSIQADIAGFRETVTDLDQCLSIVEDRVAVLPYQEAELRSLHGKVTDLYDRSRRDNVRFFGIPQYNDGSDIKNFPQKYIAQDHRSGFLTSTEVQTSP